MIAFDGFGWRFGGSPAWALRHVALHIDRGEFVAVAGASGSVMMIWPRAGATGSTIPSGARRSTACQPAAITTASAENT